MPKPPFLRTKSLPIDGEADLKVERLRILQLEVIFTLTSVALRTLLSKHNVQIVTNIASINHGIDRFQRSSNSRMREPVRW